jgi:hypothetical protein
LSCGLTLMSLLDRIALCYSKVKVHVMPTEKFLGNLSTPKIARLCLPFSPNTFINKSEAPSTKWGAASPHSSEAW